VIDTLFELLDAMNEAHSPEHRVAFVRDLGDKEVEHWRLELSAAHSHGRR
jgi:hypothetical protein